MSQAAVSDFSILFHHELTEAGKAVPTNNRPYADLPPIVAALFEAKATKGNP